MPVATLADLGVVFVKDFFALGLAKLLHHHLPGCLRGDTPEILRRDDDRNHVAHDGIGFEVVGRCQ